MARTALPVITPKGPYPGTVNPTDLDFVFTAADAVNKNYFPYTGKELILVNNPDAAPHTITLTSAPDNLKRSADIATYSVGATTFSVFDPSATLGWIQGDGNFYLESNSALVKFAIIRHG